MDDILTNVIKDKQAKVEKIKDKYNSLIAKYFTTQEENSKKITEISQNIDEYKEKITQLKEKIQKINIDFDSFLNSLQVMQQYGVFQNNSTEFANAQARKNQINDESTQEIAKLEELIEQDNNKIRELTVINQQIEEAIKGLQANLEEVLNNLEKDIQEILSTVGEMSNKFDEQIDLILLTISKLDLGGIIDNPKNSMGSEENTDKVVSPSFDFNGYEQDAAKIIGEVQSIKKEPEELTFSAPQSTDENTQDLSSEKKLEEPSQRFIDLSKVLINDEQETKPIGQVDPSDDHEESMGDYDLSVYDQFNNTPEKTFLNNNQTQYLDLDKMDFSSEEKELITSIMPAERFNQVTNILNNYGIDLRDLNGVEPFVDQMVTVDPKILDQNLNLLRSVGKNNDEQDLLFNLNYIFSTTPENINENIRVLRNGNADFKTVSILRLCYGEKLKRNIERLRSQGIDVSEIGKKFPISSVLLSDEELLSHVEGYGHIEDGNDEYSQFTNKMNMAGQP